METIPHPPIATEAEWREARLKLLAEEKALTIQHDKVNADRRRLPMVKVEKDYVFEGPAGQVKLVDLFEGCHQLIVYHFMYGPDDKAPCDGCSGYVKAIGDITMLAERDTNFILVSRSPYERLKAVKEKMEWTEPWYSSFCSDFNYDYNVTHDQSRGLTEYNFTRKVDWDGEDHGLSVFFRIGDDVYHTYSAYARGTEMLTDSYALLDVTPYGRQEDFEDSPAGWPQKPTYG